MSSNRRHRRETDESWMQAHWRPMMAWQYLIVCLFDFMLAPIFMAWFSIFTKSPLIPWVPLTVQGGGLYHLAMGAVVGITSYAKTQERVAVTNNSGGFPGPSQQFGQFSQIGGAVETTQTTSFQPSKAAAPPTVAPTPVTPPVITHAGPPPAVMPPR